MGCAVDTHHHQGVVPRADGCQRVLLAGLYEVVAFAHEAAELLAHVVVLHAVELLCAAVEVALHQAPLVVVVLHILPVNPCCGAHEPHVLDEFLCQSQVAVQSLAACTHFAHPQVHALLAAQGIETGACFVVGLVGVRVPLSHQRQDACLGVGFEALHRGHHAGLVGSRDDGLESRSLQDGMQHPEEGYLGGEVEVASLLAASGIPVVGVRFVEGVEGLEFDAVLVPVVQAHIHQIMGKLSVAFGPEIVLRGIFVAATATAHSHIVGGGVAECLEDGIRPALLDLQHDFPLGCIALPVPVVFGVVLEALHLGSQSLALAHVVRRAVAVHGVVASTYVVAEDAEVESLWAYQPIHQAVYPLFAP